MTSEDRKRIRYARRCLRREMKKAIRAVDYDDFDKVFSFAHLWKSYRLSRRGVSWKKTVAKFIGKASLYIHKIIKLLKAGKFKSPGFNTFWINERGKRRYIQAVAFFERVVQRCLCDYCLNLAFLSSFVLDNWASQKNKGYHFAIKRIRKKIASYIRKHGLNGYVAIYDFKDFFASLVHNLVKDISKQAINDKSILKLLFHFIDCFGERGLGLGSQISQILALAVGNKIDHYIAENFHVFFNGRYMDDGIIIAKSKEELQKCLDGIETLSAKLGLTINKKKTHIIKLSHGFTFLKKRFSFAKKSKIVMKIARKSIAHERVKLKKLARMAYEGLLEIPDVIQSWQSWKGYASFGNSYHAVKNMEGVLYSSLRRALYRRNSRQKHALLWRGGECA